MENNRYDVPMSCTYTHTHTHTNKKEFELHKPQRYLWYGSRSLQQGCRRQISTCTAKLATLTNDTPTSYIATTDLWVSHLDFIFVVVIVVKIIIILNHVYQFKYYKINYNVLVTIFIEKTCMAKKKVAS